MKIVMHDQRMSILPYPQPGQIGNFTPQRVWIEDSSGKTIGQLEYPLSSFAGYTSSTPWDQFDGLMIQTLRRVVSRLPSGPQINGPSGVLVVITDAIVHK
jgi:hypothetical protein